ncbi:hypothetical protein ERO13_D04G068650v2 [Gossypium hirsutum]|uniref:Protein kinase domain-containing protein n=1 Tax=Gossypium barbadense TaxID=3634 RepID=A0A5J5RSS8_GOSBA|nr:hypothetical protein ES319_D04G076900v1 [Gossypium barbadense]KAG4151497.1 hypothetical protein ERO13_D04G068650v2 [Gossypium hirsutum]
MDQYQKVEKSKAETPINENKLRIIQISHRDLKLENTLLDGIHLKCQLLYDFPIIKLFFLTLGVVISVAFKTQINSWNSSIYGIGSSGAARV